MPILQFHDVAGALPYHAALVWVRAGGRGRLLLHGHADFYELVFVTAGQGNHMAGSVKQPLRAGDLILVRPGDRHGFTGSGPEGLRFINVAFPVAIWRAFTDATAFTPAQRWDHLDAPPHAGLGDLETLATGEFGHVLESFHRRPRALDLARLWGCILPALEHDEPGDERPGAPGWLVRACAAMAREENLRDGLPRFLELAAVSHGHLARAMRVHYGRTPVSYITDRRLAYAALLLTTTAESVGRVASRCGFASVSYFGRGFRERYGLSPREYRRAASRAIAPVPDAPAPPAAPA